MSNNFTIVTPNYNMGEYLADTIESVIKNLRPGDEYYIVDGGSSDNSVEIIKRYEKHITGWISERDTGYADALAKGFAKSQATFQCWINSGDLLLPGALDQAQKYLETSNADMIFGDDFYIDDKSNVVGFSRGACDNLRNAMLFGDWTPLQDACFWRAEIYRKVGGLDIKLRNAADYDLFARFSTFGKTKYVACAFSAFRRHNGQRSIAHKASYKAEKQATRTQLVALADDGYLSKCLLRIWYFIGVRWRVRVLHRWWDLPNLHGAKITQFSARFYGRRDQATK